MAVDIARNREKWVDENVMKASNHVVFENVRTVHVGKDCVHIYLQNGYTMHIYSTQIYEEKDD